MDSFIYSLNATIPVFAVIIAGGLFRKAGLIDAHFAGTANKFVFKVCLPCLVFKDLAGTDIRRNFDLEYVSFCFACTLISILVIWALARIFIKDKTQVGAFVQGAYRSSAAILGVAFIQNIYGTSGMAPLMIIGSVPLYNIFAVIILVFENGSREKASLTAVKNAFVNVLKNPIIIGIFLGLAASFLNVDFPAIFDKTINNFAAIASPLALVSIGASFEIHSVTRKIRPAMAASFIKLVALAAIFLPLAVYTGFREQKLIAILIMLASPCTPTAYIMAKNMGGDDTLASGIVVITTLFSSITLTGWIFLMRTLELIQ